MPRCATVTDAWRIGMRPRLVRAAVIDASLENMGHMRSLAAGAHLEITHRYNGIVYDVHERCAVAGAVKWGIAVRKRARGDRCRAGAEA
jgi:hypothetical protein